MSALSISPAIFVDDTALTVEVTGEVRDAITEWERAHIEDLNERLAPFGINAYDLIPPEYYRVVTAEDLS